MLSRAQALPLALLVALALILTGCGDDSTSDATGFDAVEVSGDFGKQPDVTIKERFEVSSVSSKTLVEGDGPEVEQGDKVEAHLWIGNGYTREEAYTTFDAAPQTLTADSKTLSKAILEGLLGHTIGSRVMVTAPASAAFGPEGNPQLGVGNKDSIVLVVDILDEYSPPEPKDVSAKQLPRVVEKKGVPVGFDFSGVDEPKKDGDLLRAVVEEGDGETVTEEMTVTADYLGAVYDAKEPFDESYSKEPVPFALDSVVQGWTYGLTGVEVGSRVLLQIPPELGYGSQEQANIPADSTLYFVIDVKKAK